MDTLQHRQEGGEEEVGKDTDGWERGSEEEAEAVGERETGQAGQRQRGRRRAGRGARRRTTGGEEERVELREEARRSAVGGTALRSAKRPARSARGRVVALTCDWSSCYS